MEITELGAVALSERLARREVSAAEVMEATLDRIDRVNPGSTPSSSLRDRDALMAEARAADAAPRKGWLHGIPIAVKDLADDGGDRHDHGLAVFATNVPKADCGMVARMKAAGAHRHRQDERARVRPGLAHRQPGLRPDAERLAT